MNASTLPEALLFDMDGTLSDTEVFWQRAEERLVREYGTLPLVKRDEQLLGVAMNDSATFLQRHHGVQLEVAAIQQLIIEYVMEQIEAGFEWRPGALELLAEARQYGIPRALVTASPRIAAEAIVSMLPSGTFDLIIADEDAARSKPAPDPYVTAAGALGVDSARCVAFEDSPTGVSSALSAGCFVVAIPADAEIRDDERLVVLPSLSGVTLHDISRLNGSHQEK
ncbi:HAD family hydrolase [Populibacterium corticicola]|uniref:HAD family hydrolase n=1 Tax=Populibacterium corticicola TaxID=1812826 RepID=A0ABW5XCK0_9MICO